MPTLNIKDKRFLIVGFGKVGAAVGQRLLRSGCHVDILTGIANPRSAYEERCRTEGGTAKLASEDYDNFTFINDTNTTKFDRYDAIIDASSTAKTKTVLLRIIETQPSQGTVRYFAVTPDPNGENKGIYESWAGSGDTATSRVKRNKFQLLITSQINTLAQDLLNPHTADLMQRSDVSKVAISDYHRENKEVFMKTLMDFLLRTKLVTEEQVRETYKKLDKKIKERDKTKELGLVHEEVTGCNGIRIVISSHRGMDSSELYAANNVISAFIIDIFDRNGKQIFTKTWHADSVQHFVDGILDKAIPFFNFSSPNQAKL